MFASRIKSSLKCTWIYAADVKSRLHFQDKKYWLDNGVKNCDLKLLCITLYFQSLGCLLYCMAFLESPFEKIYQRGDSIALGVLGRKMDFPSQSG